MQQNLYNVIWVINNLIDFSFTYILRDMTKIECNIEIVGNKRNISFFY